MRTIIVTAAALALSGCAAQIISSNPRSVVVRSAKPPNTAQAVSVAEAECTKYGRHARMVGRPSYGESDEFVFDCVE